MELVFNLIVLIFLVWFLYGWTKSGVSGAPFVPTMGRHVRPLLELADLTPDDVLYDLGCGDGKVLISAVRDFNIRRAVGVDISPLPLALARLRVAVSGLTNRISIRKADMYSTSLDQATVLFTYLLTGTIDKLAEHLKTAKPGTRLVSAAFPLDTAKHPEFRLVRQTSLGSIQGFLYIRV